MSPKGAENEEAFDFFCYYTDFNNAIKASKENEVALGGLPHTVNVFDGGEYKKPGCLRILQLMRHKIVRHFVIFYNRKIHV